MATHKSSLIKSLSYLQFQQCFVSHLARRLRTLILSNQGHKANKVKLTPYLRFETLKNHIPSGRAYLPSLCVYVGLPPEDFINKWQASKDLDDECPVIHRFPLVKCCFCSLNMFELKCIKWFISLYFLWRVTGSFISFIKLMLVGHETNQGRQIYKGRHAYLTKEYNVSL